MPVFTRTRLAAPVALFDAETLLVLTCC